MVHTGRANQNDEARLGGLLLWRPEVPTAGGTQRKVLAVMADAAYGTAAVMAAVVALGYRCLIKPRGRAGEAHGSGLGAKRYVIERTMAWLGNFRRLKLCYERTWHSTQGLHELAACVICANRLRQVRAEA